jgi:xylose isomerase
MDHAYLPTIGHALAVAQLTRDPKRVGCVIESAHAILAGLDPADEIDFAMSFGKLWSLHLNDQNGLKFDQDKPFASANLRVAFNQVRALERNQYGRDGEFVCFDVHPFRTTKPEHWLSHLENSRRTFLRLVEKSRSFDEKKAQALIAERDYQALDQLVLDTSARTTTKKAFLMLSIRESESPVRILQRISRLRGASPYRFLGFEMADGLWPLPGGASACETLICFAENIWVSTGVSPLPSQ